MCATCMPGRRATSLRSQGRKARRSSNSSTDQVPAGHQPQDSKGARPHSAGHVARARRRGDRMSNRRAVITLLGGAVVTWPVAARAQQPAMPVIGFITGGSLTALHQQVAGFREGIKETGYVEGQNVTVELRSAEGQLDRFPSLVSDLVHRAVAVLVVSSTPGARAAKRATSTIPIVFSMGEDPVVTGIVDSLNR